MNGNAVVLDTNILLYYLNGDINVIHFFNEYDPIISFITELEILSAPEINQSEKQLIQELRKDITIITYDQKYKSDILLLRSKKKLKLPDAIIAALSITLDIPLITVDKAFRNIENLNLVFYNIGDNE